MVYYGAKELAASSRVVRGNTIQIAEDIPESKFNFKPVPEFRSVAQIFAHIAISSRFQYELHAVEKRTSYDGLDFPTMMKKMAEEEAKPRTKAQVISLLREQGEQFAGWLEGLSDDFLGQRFNMPEGATPPFKSRFEMILSAKEHEMHHRAQLMLVERSLGIVPHLTREREARMAQRK